jgi:hypothetical protein
MALHMSDDEANAGLERLTLCQLYGSRSRRVIRRNLAEFLVSGLRYVFPGQLGELGRGMPTSILGSPTLSARFLIDDDEDDQKSNVVWPADGDAARIRGRVLTPLCRSVPLAAADDPMLYEYLALVDALRVGRARERELAKDELAKRLSG